MEEEEFEQVRVLKEYLYPPTDLCCHSQPISPAKRPGYAGLLGSELLDMSDASLLFMEVIDEWRNEGGKVSDVCVAVSDQSGSLQW